MAIHIDKDGAYVPVDLAQYGENGTLTGAYQWRDGAWRTLWEKSGGTPEPFVDNFTAPELHPRWTLVSGDYLPPGLGGAPSGIQVEAQVGSTTCEVGIRGQVGSEQAWTVYLTDEHLVNATLLAGIWFDDGHVAIETEQGDEVSTIQPSPTDTVTLRLSGGVAAVLVNGVVCASAPTGLTGEGWLTASVDGPGPLVTPRITYLAYTPL